MLGQLEAVSFESFAERVVNKEARMIWQYSLNAPDWPPCSNLTKRIKQRCLSSLINLSCRLSGRGKAARPLLLKLLNCSTFPPCSILYFSRSIPLFLSLSLSASTFRSTFLATATKTFLKSSNVTPIQQNPDREKKKVEEGDERRVEEEEVGQPLAGDSSTSSPLSDHFPPYAL